MSDKRWIDLKDAECFGINEAHILSNLMVWVDYCSKTMEVEGVTYAPRIYAEWANQLPWMSERTVRRAVEKLEKAKVLRALEVPVKGRRYKIKYYGIDFDKRAYCHGQIGHPRVDKLASRTPLTGGQNGHSLVQSTSGTEDKGTESGKPPTPHPEAPGKTPQGGEKMGKGDIEKLAGKVAAIHEGKEVELKPTRLADFWRLRCRCEYNDLKIMKPPTQKELGQWKTIIKIFPKELEGKEREFFSTIIERWDAVSCWVVANTSALSSPNRPDVGFFLTHFGLFASWFDEYAGSQKVVHSSNVNLSAGYLSPAEKQALLLKQFAEESKDGDGSS